MRISKNVLKSLAAAIVAVAFLVVLNAALAFALVPFGSKSELVWTDYAAESAGDIDTVTVGTSLMQHAIDPELLGDLTSSSVYCLATPNQTLEDSLIAIQTAWEDHGITRAIIGVSSVDLQAEDAPSLGDAFLSNRAAVVSPQQGLAATGQVLFGYGGVTGQDSINALFPWIYNHVSLSPLRIAGNVRARLTESVYEAANEADPVWHYVGRGYGVCDTVLDYNGEMALPFFSEEREDGATSTELDPDRLRTLADIYDYCDGKGIELVAVSVPMPAYNIVDGDGYYELHDNVAAAFDKLGRDYYDFNFAKPDLFDNQEGYYFDTLHMNGEGSRAFTRSFARFLSQLEAVQDVSSEFYTAEDQRTSVDYISAAFADAEVDSQGVHVHARVAAGQQVEAEYQLCALDSESGEWVVVGDWTSDPDFDYAPPERGVIDLRVNARQVGSGANFDRFRILRVYY